MMPRVRVSVGCCKQWSTYLTMATFFLAGGIEYSVIFPTMYDYVRQFGGQEWLYGLSLSAFSISNLITSPLYGLIFDKTKMTKLIVLVGNLFEIGGNFMYFAAYAARSPYLILGSRFIVGMGAGAGAAIFAELSLTTSNKQRTTIFSLFMALRQLGMVVGPAFNLFLEETNFSIGPFPVKPQSSPGLFMMFLWIIVELLFLFFFYHQPHVQQDKPKSQHPSSSHVTGTVQSDSGTNPPTFSEETKSTETAPLLQTDPNSGQVTVPSSYGTTSPTRKLTSPSVNASTSIATESDKFPEAGGTKKSVSVLGRLRRHGGMLLSEMLREEIVALLGVLFITMFNQAAIETMFVPMAEELLDWTEQYISFFYSGAGLEIILAFVMVSLLSRKIGDRWLMLSGLIFEVVGYGWLLGLVGNATQETPWVMWRYIIGGAILLWGLPFVMVTGASLYSKIVPPHIQGFGQGFRRSVFSVGAILGPLWAGGANSMGGTYYPLLGLPSSLYVLVLLLVLITFVRLKEPPSTSSSNTTNFNITAKHEPQTAEKT